MKHCYQHVGASILMRKAYIWDYEADVNKYLKYKVYKKIWGKVNLISIRELLNICFEKADFELRVT